MHCGAMPTAPSALGGAALTNKVHHRVPYERSVGLTYPAGSIEAVEETLAAGDNREAAIVLVFERHRGLLDGDPAVGRLRGW